MGMASQSHKASPDKVFTELNSSWYYVLKLITAFQKGEPGSYVREKQVQNPKRAEVPISTDFWLKGVIRIVEPQRLRITAC